MKESGLVNGKYNRDKDLLAVGAVERERVSNVAIPLLTGKEQRFLAPFGLAVRFRPRKQQAFSMVCTRIPYSFEQGTRFV